MLLFWANIFLLDYSQLVFKIFKIGQILYFKISFSFSFNFFLSNTESTNYAGRFRLKITEPDRLCRMGFTD